MDQRDYLQYERGWEFPREKFSLIRSVGSGAFGEVWLAEARGILAPDERNQTTEVTERRDKIKRRLKLRAKMKGAKLEYVNFPHKERTLVAVKTLKGNVGKMSINLRYY